jgi:hypothetical protein
MYKWALHNVCVKEIPPPPFSVVDDLEMFLKNGVNLLPTYKPEGYPGKISLLCQG